jgi:type II secretory pathway component PulF
MGMYKYKAKSDDRREFTGTIEAASEKAAGDLLRSRGLSVVYLDEQKTQLSALSLNLSRVTAKDIVIFSRQFSVLISAGVTLVQALRVLGEQIENIKFKMIITEIADDVDGGTRLSEALDKHKKIFSNFFISVIKSGETSGKLDEVLNYLADEMEKDYDLNRKIKGAMIYPAFIILVMSAVGVLMMVFIIPKLTEMLKQSGGELPMATKVLMGLSDFLISYWYILIAIIGGLVFGYKFAARTPNGKLIIDTVALRLPVFGGLFQKIYLVRFCRSMQTLILGGINISQALSIAGDIVTNDVYKNIIMRTKKEVEDGNSIATVFYESKEVPKMVAQMLRIGEKSGKLDLVLSRVTEFYTREINATVDNLVSLLEPLVLVVMGIGVAAMVAAVIMPMYNMAGAM